MSLERPLDMMQLIIGQVSQEGIGQLNQRFWDRFNQADFKYTILALDLYER